MNIGVINKKSFEINEGGVKKKKSYLEMSIRPPFMESATFTLTANTNRDNEAAPDFIINYSFNRRNEKYRRARVGAIWTAPQTRNNENEQSNISDSDIPQVDINDDEIPF